MKRILLATALAVGLTAGAQSIDLIGTYGATIVTYDPTVVGEVVFNTSDLDDSLLAKYKVASIAISTENSKAITTREEYIPCSVTVSSDYADWNLEATGGIRGRGNSSWLWYDKKPYRIKFDEKQSLLGMGKGKSWVLLANYRDPTHLMNSYVFLLGQALGLQYTNSVRYAEVTLNGEYIGLYQVTEQVQQGKNRVAVDEDTGYLISLDLDDGPSLSPDETDNFWSSVYSLPICVKNPDDPSSEILSAVKADFKKLEQAISNCNYAKVKELLDVQSFIDYLIIQEFVYNVELDAPRSMFMYKDVAYGDVWHMGPLWDFDAGYDFDWATMYTGHTYFTDYKELVMGTKPGKHWGAAYYVSDFWVNMFNDSEFTADYKARWNEVKPLFLSQWIECQRYISTEAVNNDYYRWPIDKLPSTQITKMGSWIKNRWNYMDKVINNY